MECNDSWDERGSGAEENIPNASYKPDTCGHSHNVGPHRVSNIGLDKERLLQYNHTSNSIVAGTFFFGCSFFVLQFLCFRCQPLLSQEDLEQQSRMSDDKARSQECL